MKRSEAPGDFVDRLQAHLADSQEMIEHTIVGKPEHSDRIFPHVWIVHLTNLAKCQAVAAINYRHDPQIGARSEAAIQPNLLDAHLEPTGRGPVVEEVEDERLLSL